MIKVSIHPVTYLLALFALLSGFIDELFLLFLIVIIHELGHVCVALRFGWRVRRVELLPFGGVAEMEEYGNPQPKEEFWVYSSGPLMNGAMVGWGFFMHCLGWINPEFFYLFIEYNLLVLFFNLLPIWPLDGGKMVELGLSLILPYKKALQYALRISTFFFLLYVATLILYFRPYFSLWVIAIFLLLAHWREWKQKPYQFMRFLLERLKKERGELGGWDVVSITLSPNILVRDALERMYRHKLNYFCVVNQRGEVEGIFSEEEMLHLFFYGDQGLRAIGEVLK